MVVVEPFFKETDVVLADDCISIELLPDITLPLTLILPMVAESKVSIYAANDPPSAVVIVAVLELSQVNPVTPATRILPALSIKPDELIVKIGTRVAEPYTAESTDTLSLIKSFALIFARLNVELDLLITLGLTDESNAESCKSVNR